MPAKNSLKNYFENGYYHLYNRGVEKRPIFIDGQDYEVFLSYLKTYLSEKDEQKLMGELSSDQITSKERDRIIKDLSLNNFYGKIILLCYCLMPNHFHFLVKQTERDGIDIFMNSLATRYTMYFNKKYKRVGSLYQGVYKAVEVTEDNQLLYLTKYIHKQAIAIDVPSSYADFLGKSHTSWLYPSEILTFFSKENPKLNYRNFVEESDACEFDQIDKLILE